MNQKVLVLSRNYSTGLGVIRSLGMAGYQVDLIASVKKKGSSIITSSSKYVNHAMEVLTKQIQGDDGKDLLNVLVEYGKKEKDKVLLFPTDDFTAAIVDQNRNVLKSYFYSPMCVNETSLTLLMDKTFQTKLAKECNLNVPEEWIIHLKDLNIPEDMVYPCFVKPLQSISGMKNEMKKCDSYEELYKHLNSMKDFLDNRSVLIQEYLEIDKEYDLSGVCLDQDIIIPGIIEKSHIAKFERGVTLAGTMLDFNKIEEKDKIINLLKKLHYVGMFDMEFNVVNDKLYFNEINLRSGGPNFAYCLNGVNLPAIYAHYVFDKEYHLNTEIKEFNKTFVYEKVAWEDFIHGYMSKQELNDCIDKADFTLLANIEDPKPGNIFKSRIRLSAIKQKSKQFIKGNRNG